MKLISKELGLGDPDGFLFIMSVGFTNLAGIKSPMVDKFINTMRSASQSPVWDTCKQWCLDHVDEFEHIDADYINSISDELCQAITLSTMHGCPAEEIESICSYLISEKGLHLYLKMQPYIVRSKTH